MFGLCEDVRDVGFSCLRIIRTQEATLYKLPDSRVYSLEDTNLSAHLYKRKTVFCFWPHNDQTPIMHTLTQPQTSPAAQANTHTSFTPSAPPAQPATTSPAPWYLAPYQPTHPPNIPPCISALQIAACPKHSQPLTTAASISFSQFGFSTTLGVRGS